MDIKKSVKIALINKGEKQNWLAGELDMKPNTLSGILAVNRPNTQLVDKLAGAFDMKVSEFVALGE